MFYSWIWVCMLGSMQRRTDMCVRPSTEKGVRFTNHTNDSDWKTLAQRRTLTRSCGLFIAYSGERAWKATRDRLLRSWYLSRVDHVPKFRDRKQRTHIGKYSFVNKTIKNWNQLLAEALGVFPCKPKICRKRVRKAIIKGVIGKNRSVAKII